MLYILFFWGVIELVVIVLVAGMIGAMPTLGLILLGSIVGSMILKKERERLVARMEQGGQASPNSASVKDGMFRVLGGTLLFMPGFISDIFAIVCMVPALRGMFGGLLMKVFRPDIVVQRFSYRGQSRGGRVYDAEVNVHTDEPSTRSANEDDVIDGEFIEHDDHSSKRRD